jgi:hypothetical protein
MIKAVRTARRKNSKSKNRPVSTIYLLKRLLTTENSEGNEKYIDTLRRKTSSVFSLCDTGPSW